MKKNYFLLVFIFFSCSDDNIYDSKIETLNFYNIKNSELLAIKTDLERENEELGRVLEQKSYLG
ncbi:MAG: hypothetical protein LBD32_00275 [Cytophagales bacterium]|nr:hypothetical protein [Cytophagales bacterium]